jgi:hypothetical protein
VTGLQKTDLFFVYMKSTVEKMFAEVVKVMLENMLFSIDAIYRKKTWLRFADYVNLKLTCKSLNMSITKYWVFNIDRTDFRLYLNLKVRGTTYLMQVESLEVERYLQLFGYTFTSTNEPDEHSPLYKAFNNYDLAMLYMKYGADPFKDSWFMNALVGRGNNPETVKLLEYILTTHNLTFYEYTDILQANNPRYSIKDNVQYNTKLIPTMLKYGMDPNFVGTNGCSLLFIACWFSDVMNEILKYPVDLNLTYHGRDIIQYIDRMTNSYGEERRDKEIVEELKRSRDLILAEINRRAKN